MSVRDGPAPIARDLIRTEVARFRAQFGATLSGLRLGSSLSRVDTTRESPDRKKYEASTIAAGARRQAKKDQR